MENKVEAILKLKREKKTYIRPEFKAPLIAFFITTLLFSYFFYMGVVPAQILSKPIFWLGYAVSNYLTYVCFELSTPGGFLSKRSYFGLILVFLFFGIWFLGIKETSHHRARCIFEILSLSAALSGGLLVTLRNYVKRRAAAFLVLASFIPPIFFMETLCMKGLWHSAIFHLGPMLVVLILTSIVVKVIK